MNRAFKILIRFVLVICVLVGAFLIGKTFPHYIHSVAKPWYEIAEKLPSRALIAFYIILLTSTLLIINLLTNYIPRITFSNKYLTIVIQRVLHFSKVIFILICVGLAFVVGEYITLWLVMPLLIVFLIIARVLMVVPVNLWKRSNKEQINP